MNADSSFPKTSKPIPIIDTAGGLNRTRTRSGSVMSSTPSTAPSLSPPSSPSSIPSLKLHTPVQLSNPAVIATSPILSYFYNGGTSPESPKRTTTGLPNFSKSPSVGNGSALSDDDDEMPFTSPSHHRRMSLSGSWNHQRFASAQNTSPRENERGAGLLRRLSLGGTFTRPAPPTFTSPPTNSIPAVTTSPATSPRSESPGIKQRHGRSMTVSGTGRPSLGVPEDRGRRRAPSPMGERMLKGHFDGF